MEENKDTSKNIRIPYNAGLPKDISGMSIEEQRKEIKEFSEGCKELEDCLLAANETGLQTYACCKGYHEITIENFIDFDIFAFSTCMTAPYISFKSDKVLDYMSPEFIKNQNIRIGIDEQKRVDVRFYGEDCYSIMKQLTDNIKTGVKSTEETKKLLEEKLNKNVSPKILYESNILGFKQSGFLKDEPESVQQFIKSNAVLNACMYRDNAIEVAQELFEYAKITPEKQTEVIKYINEHNPKSHKESSKEDKEEKSSEDKENGKYGLKKNQIIQDDLSVNKENGKYGLKKNQIIQDDLSVKKENGTYGLKKDQIIQDDLSVDNELNQMFNESTTNESKDTIKKHI